MAKTKGSKSAMRYLFLSLMIFVPLLGVENKIFTSIGFGWGANEKTHFWQQTTKDNSSCGGTCIGSKVSGDYQGKNGNSFNIALGDEVAFDKFSITGLRLYVGMEYANVSLGGLLENSTQRTPALNPTFTTIKDPASRTPSTQVVNMVDVPNPQGYLFDNGIWMSYGVNLDFFLNLPVDSIIGLFWDKMFFLKVGIYAGGGAEYAMLKSSSWDNQSIGQNNKFFASGSGLFANIGTSIYIGRHNRINFGLKIPYYNLNAQNWYDFGDSDPWKQQLLRQGFEITRSKEWRVSYTYLF